jgi:hypothetical protein
VVVCHRDDDGDDDEDTKDDAFPRRWRRKDMKTK